MTTLFPEMDQEIRDDRKASRREKTQHARAYLKDRDVSWLVNRLLDGGPATEHTLGMEFLEREYSDGSTIGDALGLLRDILALWRVGKLWRKSLGIHCGSGMEEFVYGIRKVHSKNL